MCLAVPAKVIAIEGTYATIDLDGIHKDVSIVLLNDLHVGDYVLIHVGFALERLDPAEAEKTLRLFDGLKALDQTP